MKVISNGKKQKKELFRLICENCNSELEFERSDIEYKAYGCACVTCPVCGKDAYFDGEEMAITKNSLQFPQNFSHIGKDAAKIEDSQIEQWVRKGIDYFRSNPDSFSYCITSGDSFVLVENCSGDKEYWVTVAKDIYDCSVPYEDVDFEIQDSMDWAWENKGVHLDVDASELEDFGKDRDFILRNIYERKRHGES